MEWLCPVCETVNNHIFPKSYSAEKIVEITRSKRCRLCCFGKNEINWEQCLIMNERIDQTFPRGQCEYPISCILVNYIRPPLSTFISMTSTFDYIKQRMYYRNYNSWKVWRYKKYYRRALNRVFDELDNIHNIQFERCLILQYLF